MVWVVGPTKPIQPAFALVVTYLLL